LGGNDSLAITLKCVDVGYSGVSRRVDGRKMWSLCFKGISKTFVTAQKVSLSASDFGEDWSKKVFDGSVSCPWT